MAKTDKKKKLGSEKSGVGLTIGEMTEGHFKAHLSRVLGKMTVRGASAENIKAATSRIQARRASALSPAKES